MLNTEALKQILSTIFKIDDDHIVPITTNWFVPDVKLDGTDYIGYRIISKTPCYKQTGSILDKQAEKNKNPEQIKISFRLSFVGEHAESLSEKILTWGNNKQIKKLFDSVNSKLDM
ncbi:MAG: hypothetical protein KBT21_10375 [Treponema sp.]|nr:hypothetical protein [Candidatus Treponema merdequi]